MFRWLAVFQIKYTYGSTENMELARSYYAQAIKLCPNNIRALYGLFLVMPPCFGWSSGLPALSYFCDRLLWLHCLVFCFHPWSCGLPALYSVFIPDPMASLSCHLSSSLILWLPCFVILLITYPVASLPYHPSVFTTDPVASLPCHLLHHWFCGLPALSSVFIYSTDPVATLPFHLSSSLTPVASQLCTFYFWQTDYCCIPALCSCLLLIP